MKRLAEKRGVVKRLAEKRGVVKRLAEKRGVVKRLAEKRGIVKRLAEKRGIVKRRLVLAALTILLSACGYHIAGQGSLLPKDAHTIAVAPWGNASIHYTLSNYLSASVSRELISRTRYRLVTDPSKADLVLYGSVANMTSGGTLYDNALGRTTGGQISVWIQYRLVDHAGKVIVNIPNLEFHQPYEISVNPAQYFDESEAAMQRLSTDVAKSVVSSMLEQF